MDYNAFITEMGKLATINSHLGVWQVLITLILSVTLGFGIAFLYIKTFKGTFYSQSFAHTIIIVAVVVAMIIMVIGSNVGQAFALAGALSIIRFRSVVRDPKDVAYIFFAMGAGLACGAGFFFPAIAFIVTVSLVIILFKITNFGSKNLTRKQLRIAMPETMNQEGAFDDIFEKYLAETTLIGIKTVSLGTLYELRYSILMKQGLSEKSMLDEIRTRNGNLNVSILLEQQVLDY